MATSNSSPLVSIIVPVYKTEEYITTCLESVQNQTEINFECLIVIDGSPDNSIYFAKQFEKKDSRFVVLEKLNGGLSSARNFGIKHARGEYLSFLDSDDFWKPNKLKNQLNLFKSFPEIDIVFSQCEILKNDRFYPYPISYYNNKPLDLLYKNNIIGSGSSIIMKKDIIYNTGSFNESLGSFEDLELWFRVAVSKYKFLFCNSVDVIILQRTNSLSRDKRSMMINNIKCFQLQLNNLLPLSFPLNDIRKVSAKRINLSRKYFTEGKFFSNYLSIIKLIFLYIAFEIKFRLKNKD